MPTSDFHPIKAVVFGCAGTRLTDAERRFFAAARPLGFILFKRNCDAPGQVRALVESLRDSVGRADAPVLIDQEGGRVARLGPPHWRAPPAARVIGALAERDAVAAREAARINARLIAAELFDLGVTVDCAPVLDLPIPGASEAIGDRAFCGDPALAGGLGGAVCDGLMAGGVLPVIKHMPGHGRAMADSHHELPLVDAPLDVLRATDFAPFARLADAAWGMTAHVVYSAIDPAPATQSPRVIAEVIRGEIGFAGVLASDDIGMDALAGSPAERTAASLAAGCDVVLHCNGTLDEMAAVAAAAGPMSDDAQARIAAAEARRAAPATIDRNTLAARLDALLAQG